MLTTTTTATPSTIVDVLSGNKAVKAEIGVSTNSVLMVAAVVLIVILIGTLIIKRVK